MVQKMSQTGRDGIMGSTGVTSIGKMTGSGRFTIGVFSIGTFSIGAFMSGAFSTGIMDGRFSIVELALANPKQIAEIHLF